MRLPWQLFRCEENKSAILNFMVNGYRLMLEGGLSIPVRVQEAIAAYRFEADIFGEFIAENTMPLENARLLTKDLYSQYIIWVEHNGYKPLNSKEFAKELDHRFDVRHNGNVGKFILEVALVTESLSA